MASPRTSTPKLRIVIVSAFYSEGMGYSENCLSRALVRLGHEVHVVTSTFNVYGNTPMYDATYRDFLGPSQVEPGKRMVDGYTLHRLPAGLFASYVTIEGLMDKVREIDPDILHTLEIASIETFAAAGLKPFARFKLFCETHQNLSIMKPYMLDPRGNPLRRAIYRLTRTLPSRLASLCVEKCYAVAADCVDVAVKFYGVPRSKVKLLLLGTDTETFHPPETEADRADRRALRQHYGYSDSDIVCLYTGRFSPGKNPLLLAQAAGVLSMADPRFKALFVGEGAQKAAIAAQPNTRIIPFMTHKDLARHYRAADIAIWPREESMSMLDAAASGLPLVVSDRIGDPERVRGNGRTHAENNVDSLAQVLRELAEPDARHTLGFAGRRKMVEGFSWTRFAKVVEADYLESLGRAKSGV
jgi:glycosyltransferase involved in cell wall biosynthesis